MMKTNCRILLALLLTLMAMNAKAQSSDTEFYPPEQYVSGTLPVLYITTEDSVPITSKTEYVRAIWRLDAMGVAGVDNIGTEDEQYGMWIKGHGNSSWGRAKKPYRIKLDDKVPLLGMNPDRHFVLLTEWRDGWGRIAWEMGFTVNRLMGMPWTPDHQPVELVLNGSYMGLYFLAEKIRVDKHRVNVTEQKGKLYDPALVTGGWLCEIDNYVSSPRVSLTDRTTHVPFRTTIHSPEEVSSVQYNYISKLVDAVDKAIYCPDKMSTDWERYIDLDRIARYYVACEILYQIECFSGSCYWSKERGDSTKIMFGPLWDFDTSNLKWPVQKFCYEQQENDEVKNRNHWIAEIAKYPRFQQRVRELWVEWNKTGPAQLRPHAEEWLQRVEAAHYKDVERWYDYMKNYVNVHERFESYFRYFDKHQAWLAEQWAKPVPVIGDLDGNRVVDDRDVAMMTRHLLAQQFDALPATANTYDDEVFDLSDLVGVVRQVYRSEHPGVTLRSPITLPYGQSDKDVDPKLRLALCFPDGADTLRLVGDDQRVVPVAFVGAPSTATAFQFDLSTTGLKVAEISLAEPLADTHRLHVVQLGDTALRVMVMSDSLAHFDASGRVPALLLTLSYDTKTGSGSYSQGTMRFSGVRLVESDMYPHYAADCELPVVWRRTSMAGDVDANGIIDIDDLNAALNIMLRKVNLAEFPYADTNRSGLVDIDDVNVVINGILRKTSIVDYAVGNVHFKMVRLKGGAFMMGATPEQTQYAADNEQPPHRVTLSDYAIGLTEVTQELWQAVMGTNPSHFTGDLQRPVENVSWDDCKEFITRLNQLTGKSFRLPTEAEWEFAARGGNASQGYRYAGSNSSTVVAWLNGNSSSQTHPVAQKQPNELGIYDMSGNVSEWCQDWYARYSGPEEQVDPTGPTTGSRRVFRGGCWFNLKNVCRVSYRGKLDPTTRSNYYGLRLAM